ncbi:MAG TPA: LysR family transcriptional regulator [Burkholderiaceae bacterium]|jgi:DNA-binding transcriptional LysR family regulator|nr:LysR family transcriptional regulator [Burkholderiaceae bacterium]
MNITLRHIEVFRALMTAGSVTAAAQILFTSQPTVSRELARLESLIGIPLFDRVRGRLQPNAQALALYEEVQRSYVGLDRVMGVASRLKQFSQGQISLICLPVFSQVLLPRVCARFLAQYPGVSVAITPQDSPFLEDWLASQSYDFGLTEQDTAPAGTAQSLLLEVNEVCVLPDGHPLLSRTVLDIDDFAQQNFVSLAPNDPYRQIVDEMFRRKGVERHLIVETHSAVSVCSMVRQGIGIGVVNPLTAWEFVGHGIHIRPLAVPIPFRVHVVRPLHRPGNVVVERFVDTLRTEVTDLLATFSAA